MIRPEPSKKQWKAWDKEQESIMKKLKECNKNTRSIMEVTLKRAIQIAQEKRNG